MATEMKQELANIVSSFIQKTKSGKKDLSLIYSNQVVLDDVVAALAAPFKGKVDYVASPESLGFILGSMLARELKVGFVPIRNGSALSIDNEDAIMASYINHRNHPRSLKIRSNQLPKQSRVLLVDDWVETAATMLACVTIVEEADCSVAGIASIGADVAGASLISEGMLHTVVRPE